MHSLIYASLFQENYIQKFSYRIQRLSLPQENITANIFQLTNIGPLQVHSELLNEYWTSSGPFSLN